VNEARGSELATAMKQLAHDRQIATSAGTCDRETGDAVSLEIRSSRANIKPINH
jgi:hypothetical protein